MKVKGTGSRCLLEECVKDNYYARFHPHSYHYCKEMKFIPRRRKFSRLDENEKSGNKQCLLDTPRRVTVNNTRLISKCKQSEKKYAYLQKPWHYEKLQREITLKAFAPSL